MSSPLLDALREASEAERAHVPLRELSAAADALSLRYRDPALDAPRRSARSDLERLAYVCVRMPATTAVLVRVLEEVRARLDDVPVSSLLDLGAGPLTAVWAAAGVWPALSDAVCLDRDPAMLALGERLWQRRPPAIVGPRLTIRAADVATGEVAPADIVLLSYVLGEVSPDRRGQVLMRALGAARVALVVVEPGTPRGFQLILEARTQAIASGGAILAPCPHDATCPMQGADWCHFAARVERSRTHRQLKGGELGWEDEKFSYVVITPQVRPQHATARVVRHPRKLKGHVTLRLCGSTGLTDEVVTRRAPAYHASRHARWGDAWPPDTSEPDSIEEDRPSDRRRSVE